MIYKSELNALYNITVTTKEGVNVTLYEYKRELNIDPLIFTCFQELYTHVITICSANHFSIPCINQFGADFYRINFIDLYKPYTVSRFGRTFKG